MIGRAAIIEMLQELIQTRENTDSLDIQQAEVAYRYGWLDGESSVITDIQELITTLKAST